MSTLTYAKIWALVIPGIVAVSQTIALTCAYVHASTKTWWDILLIPMPLVWLLIGGANYAIFRNNERALPALPVAAMGVVCVMLWGQTAPFQRLLAPGQFTVWLVVALVATISGFVVAWSENRRLKRGWSPELSGPARLRPEGSRNAAS